MLTEKRQVSLGTRLSPFVWLGYSPTVQDLDKTLEVS